MAQIILFLRDDSAATSYESDNYHPFDVVDILEDGVDAGSGVTAPTFAIVQTDATVEQCKFLLEEYKNILNPDPDAPPLKRRKYKVERIPNGVKNRLRNGNIEFVSWSTLQSLVDEKL